MHVITQQRIWEARETFPQTATALDQWYRAIKKNRFNSYAELKQKFGSLDKVGDFYVFDIGGNKLRLIANIHLNRQKVYICDILSHREYELGHWKNKRGYYGHHSDASH